jgi:Fe-S protein assembly co-chaperone HscB
MSQLHPDVQHSKVPGQMSSPITATDVTRAYEVIKHPYTRALHLLALVNSTDATNTNLDQEFYIHVMELREEIEMARLEEDVKRLIDQNMERKTDVIQKLDQAFSNQNYNQAQRLVAELKYWETCEEILRGKV